ncbi:serine/threonine-protein kinase ripk4 [Histoplasma capsulatum G186AR]|uniref:Serine/threonine-protein kinase ripk4 n=1 Tax=Ajellomyces capsulatus (strain G186AR / H82 / ATCC MYA-2454 / RMSCC 2432) TaxID=447093 RepID=C0NA66_AJECG|nr:serine/threonine-protein kinase ripk4 [Histoplasma capsulatum G186AR]EEH10557.1 serine/threonine-protein kinase ripk4 [Histoplasma capsulatum G186AR]
MDSPSNAFHSDQENTHFKLTDEPLNEYDVQHEFDSESLRVLEVVSEGNEDELLRLLDNGVDLRAVNGDGLTALHLAVVNDHELLAELLLKAGSNAESASHNGSKPLYIAAELGSLALVNLLLRFNADVESHNDETGYTAFHQALLNGHAGVAMALLENKANIDALTPDGHTPLFSAVMHDDLEITEFLLDNGANKYLRDDNGETVDKLATSDHMLELLRSDRVLHGPPIERGREKPEIHYTVPSLPTEETDKFNSCQGFQGTIIDFFLEGTEKRIEKTASVYDMLYGKGPEAIMNSAKKSKMDKQASFRWYHLPANNSFLYSFILYEAIVSNNQGGKELYTTVNDNIQKYRNFVMVESDPGRDSSCSSSEDTKEPSHSRNIFHGGMDILSTIRTLGSKILQKSGHIVKPPRKSSDHEDDLEKGGGTTSAKDEGQPAEKDALEAERTKLGKEYEFQNIDSGDGNVRDENKEPMESTPADKIEEDKTGYPKMPPINRTSNDTRNSFHVEDLARPGTDIPARNTASPQVAEPLPSPSTNIAKNHSQNSVAENSNSPGRKARDISTHIGQPGKADATLDLHAEDDSAANQNTALPVTDGYKIEGDDVPANAVPGGTGGGIAFDIPGDDGQPADATANRTKSEGTKPAIPFDEHLVKGYLSPLSPTDSPLHLRRTLDQYFYAHLTDTAARDRGQVVYRYTLKNSAEPKIFMGHDHFSHGKMKDKNKNESGFMLGWVTGKKPKSGFSRKDSHIRTERWRASVINEERHHRSPASSNGGSSIEKKRLALLKRDPLNVHQMILSHIGLKTRDPLRSAHDLAQLITGFCICLFDEYQVPDEYQFFDFFERSIGAVIDQETQCFEDFANRLARSSLRITPSSEVFSISAETKLLVEIKDIIDELGILHMILSDQTIPIEEFSKYLVEHKKPKNANPSDDHSSPVRFPVLEGHLYRVEKMQRLANQTSKALYNLLDLKQKQNNVSEALSARKQAENASQQARATKDLTERGLENADLARQQADESIRQGRTVLVFTVVTIIFLPLSFMAAFFAINIDSFPWNKGDKLPMDYVLRYMFSISGAISIPFILIALNQDRIAEFLKSHGKPTATVVFIVLSLVILLSVIWTRDLAPGMKAAVTVFIVLLTILALAVRSIYPLFNKLHANESISTYSSSYS